MIVRQFLDYAVPSPQRTAEPIELSALVREALARNRLQSTEADADPGPNDAPHRLIEHIEDGVLVDGYRPELARVLDNLLGNAFRYGRDAAGHLDLEVGLQRADKEAVLTIADHGRGIAKEELARLVRPFERGDTSRSGAVGAGLGLAIVERVVRMHGARIAYQPNAPSGLRIEIRMPLATPPPPAAGATPATPA
jgi:two-component system osmolarity sensor histidine kinase EnvZ